MRTAQRVSAEPSYQQEVQLPMASQRTPQERFFAKVNFNGPAPAHRPELGPCWLWTGCTSGTYGQFWNGDADVRAHRWNYEFCIGSIPEGLTLDHLCRTRRCVEPFHVEPVTNHENILRGLSWAVRKTHCPQGHEFSGRNIIIRRGWQECRLCINDQSRKYRIKRKEEAKQ